MKNLVFLIFLFTAFFVKAQDFSKAPSIGVSTGLMNYEGDLKPNSFTFSHSNPFLSLYFKQPLSAHVHFRAGAGLGKIEAADRNNRGYLVPRNLSFQSQLKEAYAGLELFLFNPEKVRFNPYVFLGGAIFHFNPYAFDRNGKKVYLQPLSTEGQGLPGYPSRKPYALTQYALGYAGGFKFEVNQNLTLGWEVSQRKTFTDYLDDVSSAYVDRDKLFAARGQTAVDMAFRGGEINPSAPYPKDGEQRGTPTENDWYYFFGVNIEIKLSALKEKLSNGFRKGVDKRINRCPSVF